MTYLLKNKSSRTLFYGNSQVRVLLYMDISFNLLSATGNIHHLSPSGEAINAISLWQQNCTPKTYFTNGSCFTNLVRIYVLLLRENDNPIWSRFTTFHDNCSVVTCAKLWHDWIIQIKIRANIIFIDNPLMKWSLENVFPFRPELAFVTRKTSAANYIHCLGNPFIVIYSQLHWRGKADLIFENAERFGDIQSDTYVIMTCDQLTSVWLRWETDKIMKIYLIMGTLQKLTLEGNMFV